MEQQFITIFEAAKLLSTHPNTIRNMISRGDLAAFRVGPRAVRIEKGTLLDSLAPYRAGEFGQWKTR